jgi:hypothetical protein
MSIVLKKDESTRTTVILNTYGIVLSTTIDIPTDEQHMYDGETEMVNQVGIRYGDMMDDTIIVLTCLRNAKLLGLSFDNGLWEYNGYICVRDKTYTECLRVLWYTNLIYPYKVGTDSPLYGQMFIDLYKKTARIGEVIKVSLSSLHEIQRFPAPKEG